MNLKKKGENMLRNAEHSRKMEFLIYLEYAVSYECTNMFTFNNNNEKGKIMKIEADT